MTTLNSPDPSDEVIIEIISIPSGISIYRDTSRIYTASIEVYSNYPESLLYQWQVFNIQEQQWENLVGETNSTVLLDKTAEENYVIRCIISVLDTIVISNSILINIEIVKSYVFREEYGHCITDTQIDELNLISFNTSISNISCSREDINTCGVELEDLISTYPFYNYQRGTFKQWGDISYPWEISSLTPNLLFNSQDNQWKVAKYSSEIAYFYGDRVLLIEDDGYQISLYEATQNVSAISGSFDFTKWKKICHIKITKPILLPSIDELKHKYKLYKPEFFLNDWEEYSKDWSLDLYNQTLSHCSALGGTIQDLEKCIKNNSSDKWENAKVLKEFFYRKGDLVLQESECSDILCLYVANQDIPANEENFTKKRILGNKDPYWQKIYCVSTKENKCLGVKRKREPEFAFELVEIGSKGHYVELPIQYPTYSVNILDGMTRKKKRYL